MNPAEDEHRPFFRVALRIALQDDSQWPAENSRGLQGLQVVVSGLFFKLGIGPTDSFVSKGS